MKFKKYVNSLIILMFLYFVFTNLWLSDDAFITFRYVDNLFKGYGLVFNPGERVEGFTHPLWLMIIVFIRFFDRGLTTGTVVMSILLSLLSVFLLINMRYKDKFNKRKVYLWNFSLYIMLGSPAFIHFSTGGLETPLYFLLFTLFAYSIFNDYKIELNGILLALLFLTRPDFGIFLPIYLLFLLITKVKLSKIISFLTVYSVVILPYQVFRMGYYASVLPNTFFAKLGGGSYYKEGIIFFYDFLKHNLFILIVFIAVLTFLKKNNISSQFLYKKLLFFTMGIVYMFFVVKEGGGYMHGRFMLPSLLLVTISSYTPYRNIKISKLAILVVPPILFFISIIYGRNILFPKSIYTEHLITNERAVYMLNRKYDISRVLNDNYLFKKKLLGKRLKDYANKLNRTIIVGSWGIGRESYYAGEKVRIIDLHGLTDFVVARTTICAHSRPGHEKKPPFSYFLMLHPTFTPDIPFKLWEKVAKTKAGIIMDLSILENKKAKLLFPNIKKKKIDEEILKFINSLKNNEQLVENADFLYFLYVIWYPYSRGKYRNLFYNKISNTKRLWIHYSEIFNWKRKYENDVLNIYNHIRGKLNFHKFVNNFFFSFYSLKLRFNYDIVFTKRYK